MAKIRVLGDNWTNKETLKSIFISQRAISEEYVDIVSYFGGF